MSNLALELKLTRGGGIAPGAAVVFDEQTLSPAGIAYNNTTGIITFSKIGQYAIQWWVATETTLKGAIGFELQSSQGRVTPGCSPIKTGQVSGFGVMDAQTAGITLSLVNKSTANTAISRKAGTKACLLVTPISTCATRVYRGNLSAPGSSIEVPLGNGLYYRLEYLNSTGARLVLAPMNAAVQYDYRRFAAFNGDGATEGDYSDNATLTGELIKDTLVYNNTREMHWVLIRVQNPESMLWSAYEVRLFFSSAGARATIWVNALEEEVSY